MIPNIVHQTWKTLIFDYWVFSRSQDSVRKHLGHWAYRFWTDADLSTLLIDQFPDIYTSWCALDKHIKRIDIARYCILYIHGGLYADLDFIFTRAIDEIIDDKYQIFSYISTQAIIKGWDFMGNAMLMSQPRQSFWLDAIRYMFSLPGDTDVLDHTGPRALGKFFRLYGTHHAINVFGPEYFDNDRCADGVGEHRYGYHMRAATWQR